MKTVKCIILVCLLSLVFAGCGSVRNVQRNENSFRQVLKEKTGDDYRISGGTGQSVDDAIVIEIRDMRKSVDTEYAILRSIQKMRGVSMQFVSQMIIEKDGRQYDVLEVETTDLHVVGQPVKNETYYFDVTKSYGNFGKFRRW